MFIATKELIQAVNENTAARKRMGFYSAFRADMAIAGITTLGHPTLTAALSVAKGLAGSIAAVASLAGHIIGGTFPIHGSISAVSNLSGNLTGTEIMMEGNSSASGAAEGLLTVTPA